MRFKTYCFLLRAQMSLFPELEPSLVETSIGEVDEPLLTAPSGDETVIPRSASDRYSYHAAISNSNDHNMDSNQS